MGYPCLRFCLLTILIPSVISFPLSQDAILPNRTVLLGSPTITVQDIMSKKKNSTDIPLRFFPGWLTETVTNAAKREPTAEPDEIIFRDIGKETAFVPGKSSKCTGGDTFCENVDNYPSMHLDQILHKTGSGLLPLFGKDAITDDSIHHRINDEIENQLCASREQLVYPKSAKNKEDQWRFIVNQGEYIQGVRIETCVNEGSNSQQCFYTDGFPLGYKTSCKQKYIYRRLLALDENGEPVSDTFQLPSCCSCVVKIDSLNTRSGFPNSRQTPVTTSRS